MIDVDSFFARIVCIRVKQSSDVCVATLASLIFSNLFAHTVCARLSRSDFVQLLVAFASRFDHVQHATGQQCADTDASTGICPAHVVVFPMWHPVASIATCAKYDDGDQSEYGCKMNANSIMLWRFLIVNGIGVATNTYHQPPERLHCSAKPPCSDRHRVKSRRHRLSVEQTPATVWMSAWRRIARQCRNQAANNREWCSTPLRIPTCNRWSDSRRSDECQ